MSGNPIERCDHQVSSAASYIYIPSGIDELELSTVVAPFLEVIRCETASGPITGVALSSMHKFLTYGILSMSLR